MFPQANEYNCYTQPFVELDCAFLVNYLTSMDEKRCNFWQSVTKASEKQSTPE